MKPIAAILLLAAFLSIALPSAAQRRSHKTTRPGLKPAAVERVDAPCARDTITDCQDSIRLSGYDKMLRSTRESMFVSNNYAADTIRAINLTLTYSDMDDRQLHERSLTVECDIPPGHTRCIDIPSWDRQHSFYYFRSSKPKRADGTPYRVAARVNAAIVPRHATTATSLPDCNEPSH